MADVRISAKEARERHAGGGVRFIDCRFELSDPLAGRAAFESAHLPGAAFADLDTDLSDLTVRDQGRHPLPGREGFHRWLERSGCRHDEMLIVYDEAIGAMAGRAWWLLRHAGHPSVRLLDGGLTAWARIGGDLESGAMRPQTGQARWSWGEMPTVGTAALSAALAHGDMLLVDARAERRFLGLEEPLDRVAGHVPGAVNRPLTENVANGLLLDKPRLRAQWERVLASRTPDRIIHMCGSGVTACFNVLAMEDVGLAGSVLYWPSWSGWVVDPARPVAVAPTS